MFRGPATSTLTPEQAKRLRDLELRRDRPHGHHTLEVEERFEEPDPARALEEGQTWYLPGLVYALVGLDRSVFEMYRAASGKPIPVRCHRTQEPLLGLTGNPARSSNPWFYTLQGIPQEAAKGFEDYLASYVFKTPQDDWRVTWGSGEIVDPFWTGARWVPIRVLLPRNLRTGRTFRVERPNKVFLSSRVDLTPVQDLSL